jgi:hypothetical protein
MYTYMYIYIHTGHTHTLLKLLTRITAKYMYVYLCKIGKFQWPALQGTAVNIAIAPSQWTYFCLYVLETLNMYMISMYLQYIYYEFVTVF